MFSFEFSLPTTIKFGEGVSLTVADEVKALGNKKPMIVTDKGLIAAGVVEKITKALDEGGVEYTIFDGIEPNPRDTTVQKAYEQAKVDGNDSMIAIGGGSSMDTAKAVGVLMTNGGVVNDYEGLDMFEYPICDLIAIPTTCGTGSEVTFWSVITDTKRHFKMSLGSPKCAAKVALVDPDMVASLPPSIIAATGMDALSHAVEGYTCKLAEPITDACGIYAIKLIGDNIRDAVYTDSKEAKGNMLLGSLIAGICFGNSDIAGIHCMGEALGGLYDTAHGVTMALLLPYVTEYNYVADFDKYANIAEALGENITGLPKRDAAAKAVDALHKLCTDLCIPTMKEIGAKEEDLDELAQRASVNVSVDSNPRKATKEDFLEIFKKAYNA
ncbi:MAG: iron-containing alcohol dehydrogenase [Bacillota bacterium]|nr:iron-containing alcohol dehydrogenase [Bacillota bacterium]